MLDAYIPGVYRFVFWYGTRLWCFLLVNPTTLFFVSSALRTTHTGAAILASCNIHVPIVSRRHSLLVGPVSPALRSSSAEWSNLRCRHMAAIGVILVVSGTVGYGRRGSRKWRCMRPDWGDCVFCRRYLGGLWCVPWAIIRLWYQWTGYTLGGCWGWKWFHLRC